MAGLAISVDRDEPLVAEGEGKSTRMAVTLFVSHAPADDTFARALTQALIEAGMDARAETFGPDQQTPRDEHESILRDSMIFLPVLSRAALSSPRARAEARQFYDTYHEEFGRFILPVLVEPLEVTELWPFLQAYQRIEGPSGEEWKTETLIAGVLQWVTLVIPARARTPSGALRQTGGPARQSYMLQTSAQPSERELAPLTRPLGEALIAVPSDNASHPRGRSALTITLRFWSLLPFVQLCSGTYTSGLEIAHIDSPKYQEVHQRTLALGSTLGSNVANKACSLRVD
jgi:TIR domain